jgi:mono/diheme cytochrome c family protein
MRCPCRRVARIAGWLLVSFAAGCHGAPPAVDPGPSHPGEAWYALRAAQLGIDEEAARTRDAALPTETPIAGRDAPELRREARALWRDLCAGCHGSAGRREDAQVDLGDQEPPRDWGSFGSNLAFAISGDGFRVVVYRRIAQGGDRDGNPSRMPAWEGELSREQIWGLVALVESF